MSRLLWYLLILCLGSQAQAQDLINLQELIDAAEADSVLVLQPGRYAGPVVIDKPMTLDGAEQNIVGCTEGVQQAHVPAEYAEQFFVRYGNE